MKHLRELFYISVVMMILMPLAFMANSAVAMYLNDGAKETSPGVYVIPNDGVCVVGVAADGTLLIDTSITNSRDCTAYTKSSDAGPVANLRGMTTNAACTRTGDAGNTAIDGRHYKYKWATSGTCVNAASPTVAISLEGLDNTVAMCTSRGGTTLTTPGTCVAYGWVYMNRKTDGSLPVSGTAIPGTTLITTTGAQDPADALGFCYTTMRMTSGAYNSITTCPSFHNSPTGNAAEWPACLSSTTGCQTQASFDAGLGWAWDGTNSRCNYDYGVKGILNADLTNTNNGRPTLPNCNGVGTLPGSAGSCVDLTGITSQGACLSVGGTWDNWLIRDAGRTTKTNADAGYNGMPANAMIVKLDAITPIKDNGGNFRAGTGAICLKCHSDQSRSYMERNKPGFVETPHQKAGDTPGPWQTHFTAANSDWGLKGVQCTMCHGTARPAQDDLIQVVPPGTVGPPAAGAPVSATGHNKTEYGSAVTDVCFHCHGNFPSANAASVIPVSSGDLALTGKGLAPIANQFLNSPHAKYTGTTSTKVDIANKNNYASTFAGYICRSSNSIGGGSIITTAYRNGEVIKIPFVDATTNAICSNAGDGAANSGAGGFWVRDGESNAGANPLTTDQGSCMTCHDVHWDFDSVNPEAEPIRRECTTCHVNPNTSATNAPQVTTTIFKHPTGPGTPLENIVDHPYQACETCHMPFSSDTGSRMHLWRINTDSNYSTMGATQANTAPDGSYTNAAWVDVNRVCGQCHKTGGAAFAITAAQASAASKNMHGESAVVTNVECLTCHGGSNTGGAATIIPGTNHHAGTCNDCHYAGAPDGRAPHDDQDPLSTTAACNACHATKSQALINHPNKPSLGTPDCSGCHSGGGLAPSVTVCNGCHGGSAGPKAVSGRTPFLTAKKLQKVLNGGMHRNVAPVASMTVVALPSRTIQLTDTSTDFDGNLSSIQVEWGDKKVSTIAPAATVTHVYSKSGSFTIKLTATDSRGVKSTVSKKVSVIN